MANLTADQVASWVIRERATGRVIMETFNANLIDKLKVEYEAVPIEKHLGDLNAHCKDCCCARSWKALDVGHYTGKSIPEHITEMREALQGLVDWWEKDGGDVEEAIERGKSALRGLKHE